MRPPSVLLLESVTNNRLTALLICTKQSYELHLHRLQSFTTHDERTAIVIYESPRDKGTAGETRRGALVQTDVNLCVHSSSVELASLYFPQSGQYLHANERFINHPTPGALAIPYGQSAPHHLCVPSRSLNPFCHYVETIHTGAQWSRL